MKLFFSELTANPAYYSYGYAVYGALEEGDDLSDIYARGFLPFVGARDQEPRMVYMARGSRIRLADYRETNDQTGTLRKCERLELAPIEATVREKKDVPVSDELVAFLLAYFSFRFGKESMPEERLRALLASPLLTHIAEYRLKGRLVGYTLETQTPELSHVWYEAYAKEYEGKHVGMYLFIDFVRRAREAGKRYAYLGATYGTWMRYKTNFKPLEYWNGREWVGDARSASLKRLLAGDGERILGFTDEWRESRRPYYPSPYPFRGPLAELRTLLFVAVAFRRIAGTILIALGALAAYAYIALSLP